MSSNPPFKIQPSNFSLNIFGITGFFGGDQAISAILTIHYYKGRKFLGWYNSPGSWNVGKEFGRLANSRFWNWLFPGPNEEPIKFFELDGKQGPKYVASRHRYVMEHTGHLVYLIMQRCKELEYQVERRGRVTTQYKVTIIKMQQVFDSGSVHKIAPRSGCHTLVAILPIAVSFTACALCGWTRDWFCFSMILLGMVSSSIFSVVIGSACLKLQGITSAATALTGDGMLMDGNNIVLLLGKEGDVATIMRGRFILKYDPWFQMLDEEPMPVTDEYATIGLCSLLLVIQFLVQLLLIPQGTLFSQLMFLSSFTALWVYNLYLSLINKEYIQEKMILEELGLEENCMLTCNLGSRPTAAVFACLMLQPPGVCVESELEDLGFKPERIICNFILNDTPVWITWSKKVLDVMRKRDSSSQDACHRLLKMSEEEKEDFGENKGRLLRELLEDAKIAYDLAMEVQGWLREN
ncbi:hypothetical protein F4604DRAFT_1602921 [Suillus subluteus]|nr:hypothetical protein F4604DRAFT_1602921 [Suillus subluteus]